MRIWAILGAVGVGLSIYMFAAKKDVSQGLVILGFSISILRRSSDFFVWAGLVVVLLATLESVRSRGRNANGVQR